MKKLLISIMMLLLAVFLVPSKAYAYYENSDLNNIIDTYSWSYVDYYDYTINGNIEEVYVYEIDDNGAFNNAVSPRHITLFFADVVSESFAYYIGFNTSTGVPDVFYQVPSDDGAKIDFNLFSYNLPAGQELYLHIVHDSLFDPQAVMPYFFNALRFYKGPLGQFAQYIINDSYVNGYYDGIDSLQEDLREQYRAGYDAGLTAEEEAQMSIINFVPQMLGSVWGFVYTLIVWKVPFINISLLDIFLIVGAISLIIILVRLVI